MHDWLWSKHATDAMYTHVAGRWHDDTQLNASTMCSRFQIAILDGLLFLNDILLEQLEPSMVLLLYAVVTDAADQGGDVA